MLSTYVIMGFFTAAFVIVGFNGIIRANYEYYFICGLMLMLRAPLYSRMYLNREENRNDNAENNTEADTQKTKEITEKTEQNMEENVKEVVTPWHDSSLELVQSFLSAPYDDTCPCYDCNFGLASFYTIPGIIFLIVGFPVRYAWCVYGKSRCGDGLFICGSIMTGTGLLFGFQRLVCGGRSQKASNVVRHYKCTFILCMAFLLYILLLYVGPLGSNMVE